MLQGIYVFHLPWNIADSINSVHTNKSQKKIYYKRQYNNDAFYDYI